MIREFRPADAPLLFALMRENFPEEEALYGTQPEAYRRIVRRIYRWDARVVLGLARAVGRPIFRFLTVEVDGRMVATTLLSFAERAGYVSMVMVDRPYRGRGYARALLERARGMVERAHRRYIVLDVLRGNTPAIALYESLGYRDLREVGLFSRPLASMVPAGPPAPVSLPRGVRPYDSRDRAPLADVATRTIPPPVAEVLPMPKRALGGSGTLDRILSSESENWVLEREGAPVAWVSVTSSDAMEAAGMAAPIIDESADAAAVDAMLAAAVEWCARRGAVRIVCQVPLHSARSIESLQRAGFVLAHTLRTMYRPVAHA